MYQDEKHKQRYSGSRTEAKYFEWTTPLSLKVEILFNKAVDTNSLRNVT
jgi:hypothetical protein